MLNKELLTFGLVSLLACEAVSQEQAVLSCTPLQQIPLLGFGTWNLDRKNASDVVFEALNVGYRHIDCAAIYGDEKEVGTGLRDGLKAANLEREDIWVTSKLWNDQYVALDVTPIHEASLIKSSHSPDLVPKALNQTLHDLKLPYLDLYLMHWPVSFEDNEVEIDYLDTWKAMVGLLETGLVRHIGVSNFSPTQLRKLIRSTPNNPPFAHQMELHPYLKQQKFVDWHQLQGIHVTAYSPLGNMNPTYKTSRKGNAASYVPPLLKNQILLDIAEARSCTPAQVALQWGRTRGTSVIPKSVHAERIKENFESLDCHLQPEDLKKIEFGLPVKRFNNPSKSWGVSLYDGLQDASISRSLEALTSIKQFVAWTQAVWFRFRNCGTAARETRQ